MSALKELLDNFRTAAVSELEKGMSFDRKPKNDEDRPRAAELGP